MNYTQTNSSSFVEEQTAIPQKHIKNQTFGNDKYDDETASVTTQVDEFEHNESNILDDELIIDSKSNNNEHRLTSRNAWTELIKYVSDDLNNLDKTSNMTKINNGEDIKLLLSLPTWVDISTVDSVDWS